jgi:hypothetical protein
MSDRSQDEAGVLRNLPRTRPGRRSEKRSSAATAARPAPADAAAPPPRPEPEPPERSADPVGEIVRGGLRVAGTGVRVADTVARELLRRIPRP